MPCPTLSQTAVAAHQPGNRNAKSRLAGNLPDMSFGLLRFGYHDIGATMPIAPAQDDFEAPVVVKEVSAQVHAGEKMKGYPSIARLLNPANTAPQISDLFQVSDL